MEPLWLVGSGTPSQKRLLFELILELYEGTTTSVPTSVGRGCQADRSSSAKAQERPELELCGYN